MTKKDVKSCLSVKKMIFTSERHAEHPFAGQNTQQLHSFVWAAACILTYFLNVATCIGFPQLHVNKDVTELNVSRDLARLCLLSV